MSDLGRESFTQKAGAAVKPDSQQGPYVFRCVPWASLTRIYQRGEG